MLHSKRLQKIIRRLSPKYLARHSIPICRLLPHFLYKHKCCIKQRKSYKYIYFCSPLSPVPNLARHSPKSRSSSSPFSLIHTEAKCINCVSVCINREKIVYTHASTYIFVLYTYNYTIKILPCPVFFDFLSFSFYTIFKLYLLSLFLILYNSIQLYIPCHVSFVFLSFSFYTNSYCI